MGGVRTRPEDAVGRGSSPQPYPRRLRDGRTSHRPGRTGGVPDLRGDRSRTHRSRGGGPDRRASPRDAAAGVQIRGHDRSEDSAAAPFAYRDKGSMATIGHLSAVTDSFGMKFTGVTGYTMWGIVHVLYLIGWGNRIAAVFNWARALTFAKNRPHRTITYEHAQNELAEHHHQP